MMSLLDPDMQRWLHRMDPGYWKFAAAIEGLGYAPSERLDSYQKQLFVKEFEGREYHGIGHVLYILGGLEEYEPKLSPRRMNIMTVAAFFHDFEFDNVERSAETAVSFLTERGFKPDDIYEIKGLILATSADRKPNTIDEMIFRDTDWRILGSEDDVYNHYVAALQVEYGLCAHTFKEGRITFLEKLLDDTPIFYTTYWGKKREVQAKTNIIRELAWRGVKIKYGSR